MKNDINIFSIVPIEVLQDKRLTKNQLKVLIALLSFRGKNTNLVYPSREKLSERCGLPITRISTITSELSELGWLKKTGKGGFSKVTKYTLTVPKTVTVTKPVTVTKTVTRMGVTKTVTGKEHTNGTKKNIYRGVNLNEISEKDNKLAKQLLDYRSEIKKPLRTARALNTRIKEIHNCSKVHNKSIEFIVDYMMDNGWQSIKPDWIKIEESFVPKIKFIT